MELGGNTTRTSPKAESVISTVSTSSGPQNQTNKLTTNKPDLKQTESDSYEDLDVDDKDSKDEFFDVESDNFSMSSPEASHSSSSSEENNNCSDSKTRGINQKKEMVSSGTSSSSEEFINYTNLNEVD